MVFEEGENVEHVRAYQARFDFLTGALGSARTQARPPVSPAVYSPEPRLCSPVKVVDEFKGAGCRSAQSRAHAGFFSLNYATFA